MKIVISFGVKEQPKYGQISFEKAGKDFGLSHTNRGNTTVPVLLNTIVSTRWRTNMRAIRLVEL